MRTTFEGPLPTRLMIFISISLILVSACGSHSTSGSEASSKKFWSLVSSEGLLDAESYDSIGELSAASDLVAFAHFESARPGRISGNPPTRMGQALVRMSIDGVLCGSFQTDKLDEAHNAPPSKSKESTTIGFSVDDTSSTKLEDTVEQIDANITAQPMLVFLRIWQGRTGESGYRPVNSYGVWVDSTDSKGNPIAEAPSGGYPAEVVSAYIGGVRSIDELADQAVRSCKAPAKAQGQTPQT